MSSSPEELRAQDFLKKAEKRLNSWSMFSSSSKFEDAAELFEKAANNFKMAKNYNGASQAFKSKADCDIRMGNHYHAATGLVAAADILKKDSPEEALALYEQTIGLFGEGGKFGQAAKVCETMGEVMEEDNRLQDAIAKYQQAADYFQGEKSISRANKCLEKIARHSATLEQYPDSVRIFELLGTESLSNNLLKFGAKKHFLHAGFCTLARGDFVAGSQAVDRYSSLDYSFDSSREQRLLAALAQACEDYDAPAFATELSQFDAMTKLDPWEICILLRVKKSIEGQGAEGVEDDADDLR